MGYQELYKYTCIYLVSTAGTHYCPHRACCFSRKSIELPNDLDRLNGLTCSSLLRKAQIWLSLSVSFSFHSLSTSSLSQYPAAVGRPVWHWFCLWGKAVFGTCPAAFRTWSKRKNQACLIAQSCLTEPEVLLLHVYQPLSRRRHFRTLLYVLLKLNVNKTVCSGTIPVHPVKDQKFQYIKSGFKLTCTF